MDSKKPKGLKILKEKRGFALMYAFSAMMLISFIVISLSKETLIDYRISTRAIDDVRAYYAARAGVEISLLRIQIYRSALARFGKMIQDPKQKAMLDMIWSLPLPWPPVIGDEVTRVDSELMKAAVKKSIMDSSYLATIMDEGTKIDINDLASKSKSIRDSTRQQIMNLFSSKINTDEDFYEKYQTTDFEEVVNNIVDWVDKDKESLNGGEESLFYERHSSDDEELPPNRSFRTPDELRMVSGIVDDFYDVLAPRITVYGTKGINVNYASEEVLMSLSPELTSSMAKQIISRRTDPVLGPFPSAESFVNYVASELNVSIATEGDEAIPILTDAVVNFRIESQGVSRGTSREIVAVVYDFDKVRDRLIDFLQKEQPDEDKNSGGSAANQTNSNSGNNNTNATNTGNGNPDSNSENDGQQGASGRPRVVFWQAN